MPPAPDRKGPASPEVSASSSFVVAPCSDSVRPSFTSRPKAAVAAARALHIRQNHSLWPFLDRTADCRLHSHSQLCSSKKLVRLLSVPPSPRSSKQHPTTWLVSTNLTFANFLLEPCQAVSWSTLSYTPIFLNLSSSTYIALSPSNGPQVFSS